MSDIDRAQLLSAIAEVEGGAADIPQEAGFDTTTAAGVAGLPAWANEAARCGWAHILSDRGAATFNRTQSFRAALVAGLRRAREDEELANALQVVAGLGGGRAVIGWALELEKSSE